MSPLVASNPAPARTLRRLLATRRRAGAEFAEVWDDAVRGAPATVYTGAEREAWMGALQATRAAWESGYRRDGPTLRLVLLDD